MVAFGEVFAYPKLWRQARARLAAPTALFSGKTVLMIGATGTISSEAARILAGLQVNKLVFGVRDTKKGAALAEELSDKFGMKRENILIWRLNLGSFESVKEFASRVMSLPRLDVAVMAGATKSSTRKTTSDGWEETLQVMHLSSALLTLLIMPKLLDTATKYQSQTVFENVATSATWIISMQLEAFAKVESPLLRYVDEVPLGNQLQYAVVKSLYSLWVQALCAQFNNGKVLIHSLDPGITASPVTEDIGLRIMMLPFGRPVVMCARGVVNACLPIEGAHGATLIDYDIDPDPAFLSSPAFIKLRSSIWNETRAVLERLSPDMRQFFMELEEGNHRTVE